MFYPHFLAVLELFWSSSGSSCVRRCQRHILGAFKWPTTGMAQKETICLVVPPVGAGIELEAGRTADRNASVWCALHWTTEYAN